MSAGDHAWRRLVRRARQGGARRRHAVRRGDGRVAEASPTGSSTSPITRQRPAAACRHQAERGRMDNCFEAARLCGVKHTVVCQLVGRQRPAEEFRRARGRPKPTSSTATNQYAAAQDLQRVAGQGLSRQVRHDITGVRPANVTGPDKVRGSIDHVNCITRPARGEACQFPYSDAMRCRSTSTTSPRSSSCVAMADKPPHADLQFRRPHDQPGRAGRHGARVPADAEIALREGHRRARASGTI